MDSAKSRVRRSPATVNRATRGIRPRRSSTLIQTISRRSPRKLSGGACGRRRRRSRPAPPVSSAVPRRPGSPAAHRAWGRGDGAAAVLRGGARPPARVRALGQRVPAAVGADPSSVARPSPAATIRSAVCLSTSFAARQAAWITAAPVSSAVVTPSPGRTARGPRRSPPRRSGSTETSVMASIASSVVGHHDVRPARLLSARSAKHSRLRAQLPQAFAARHRHLTPGGIETPAEIAQSPVSVSAPSRAVGISAQPRGGAGVAGGAAVGAVRPWTLRPGQVEGSPSRSRPIRLVGGPEPTSAGTGSCRGP